MWIVSQDRKHVFKATNFWLNDVCKGMCKIGVGYGFGSEDEFWDNAGEYSESRAREIFEDMVNKLGCMDKYRMPIK